MTLKYKKLLLATLATASLYPLISVNCEAAGQIVVEEDSYTEDGVTTEHSNKYDLICGGYSGFDFSPSSTFNAMTNRKIWVNGGTINGVVGAFSVFALDGTNSAQDVFGNRVVINDGTISYVSGGEVAYYYSGIGNALDLSDSRFLSGNVYKNYVEVNGGRITNGLVGGASLTQSAYENSVTVNDGMISGEIVGGEVRYPMDGASIHDNSIDINGGQITGDVIAAKIDDVGTGANVSVTNNTINIFGTPNLSSANLIGISSATDNYTSLNNFLNIYTSGITAQNISGFDKINFFLPYEFASGDRILNLTGDTTNLGLDRIGLQMHGDSPLTTGDTISIIYNKNGINTELTNYGELASSADGTGNASYDGGTITRGSTVDYAMNLATNADGTELTATVGEPIGTTDNPIPESSREFAYLPVDVPDPFTDMMIEKIGGFNEEASTEKNDSFVENPINNPIDNPLDYPISTGDDEDKEKSQAEDTLDVHQTSGFNIFIHAGGGQLKTKTGDGTWTNTKRGNFDFGLARSLDSKAGTWFIAPIVEYAHGSYDSQLPNGIRGNGLTKYTAGGFIARKLNHNGFYFEASLRGGRAENTFASNDFLIQGEPTRVTYEMTSPVFASHIRLGVAKKFNANNVLDIYGIYSYAHQGSMESDLSSGEHVDFSSVHAQKLRIGYRFTTKTSDISRVYTGLAWQYESTSGATATAIDYSKHSDGSKGSSGMLEFGWQIKPNRDNPWLLDINATGWIGYQRGFNAMARMQRSI
ncbi:MAG: autotransporter outer membrane beta-barrel domain-containing protein [Selenomonadaceae bacterium]|nr:autotransporter outer membrane beta-barrel domain-containing protein [Selenomonadaceae bacterium]